MVLKIDDATRAILEEILAELGGERARQVHGEGFKPERDDSYRNGELPAAASCYARVAGVAAGLSALAYRKMAQPPHWPWPKLWWKPKNPRSDLVRAGALIVAEIARIDRAAKA